MSGGSYNYLSSALDIGDLLEKTGDLESMRDRLAGLGYAKDAALETEELIILLRQWEVRADVRIRRLAAVWKAVEWWDSCDWSEDRVREALTKYRGDTTPEPVLLEMPKDLTPEQFEAFAEAWRRATGIFPGVRLDPSLIFKGDTTPEPKS